MGTTVPATPDSKISMRGASVAHQNPKRPPLLPSESENGVRRPKAREVTSRYFSSSSSSSASTVSSGNTSSSSSLSNSSTSRPSTPKRSQSVGRRLPMTPRPSTPVNSGEMSSAAKLLVNSNRNLSASFQGRSVSLGASKVKPAPLAINSSNVRKGTPERRKAVTPVRDHIENSKPIDQQRWPGRSRTNLMNRSVDFTSERAKFSGSGAVVRALENSMVNEGSRSTIASRLKYDREGVIKETPDQLPVYVDPPNRSAASDSDSVTSGSTSGAHESDTVSRPRGVVVPARFWQETNNRLRRVKEPGSPPVVKSPIVKPTIPPNPTPAKKQFSYNSVTSPLRRPVRSASPSRNATSPMPSSSRGIPSPSRSRNGVVSTLNNNWSNTPSVLTFATDARREKVGENKIVDAHLLRLIYNRNLQWRFINARADAAMSAQTVASEKRLYNAWVSSSKLRHSVKSKRLELLKLRQNLKLHSILKQQMAYLDMWDITERDHSDSLSEAIGALEASTIRLPVVSGAKADIRDLKESVCSALDVMQAMGSSICTLLTKVEHVNSSLSDLATVSIKERDSLDQCKDLLSTLTGVQVKECSMRTHVLQLASQVTQQ